MISPIKKMLIFCLTFSACIFSFAKADERFCPNECETRLRILCLCAERIKTICLDAEKIKSTFVLADALKARLACIENLEVTNNTILNDVRAEELCADRIIANSICVREPVRFNQLESCQAYRATVVFANDTLYSLGTPLNFDTILDDPNGDVVFAPTRYIAPVSGYYMVTLQVDSFGLTGGQVILGVPTGNLKLLVNGNVFRQAFSPYLAFHNVQQTTYSALVSLEAGDELMAIYEVQVMADGIGFQNYTGTVTVDGNGMEDNRSMFKIHYLSSNCDDQPLCPPCEPLPSVCDEIVIPLCPVFCD